MEARIELIITLYSMLPTFLWTPNVLANPSLLTWEMEGKMGSPNHRIIDTHSFSYVYRVKCKGTTTFTKSSGGEGVNLVHAPHINNSPSTFCATDQIVYYTPDKSICYSLYEVKCKVVTIIISYRATTILSNTKSVGVWHENFPNSCIITREST